ncbi:hypothetical protein B5181_38105, partial [Streptomyces sp. 4F]
MARRTPHSSTRSTHATRQPQPQPLPRTRRTFGDFAKAVLAFLALAVLVVGVPLALASVIGWPLPDEAPSL